MKATFMQRLLAYIIDILIISVIASLFTITTNNQKLEKINHELDTTMNQLVDVTSGIETEEQLTIEQINEKIVDLEYEYQKATVLPTTISLILTFVYFIVFQFLNKGQTIGKKCLKIRVLTKEEKDVSFLNMFIRGFIVQGVLSSFLSLILLAIISKELYIDIYFILNAITSVFVITSALMILYRKDRQGLHDMMAKTIVIREEQ